MGLGLEIKKATSLLKKNNIKEIKKLYASVERTYYSEGDRLTRWDSVSLGSLRPEDGSHLENFLVALKTNTSLVTLDLSEQWFLRLTEQVFLKRGRPDWLEGIFDALCNHPTIETLTINNSHVLFQEQNKAKYRAFFRTNKSIKHFEMCHCNILKLYADRGGLLSFLNSISESTSIKNLYLSNNKICKKLVIEADRTAWVTNIITSCGQLETFDISSNRFKPKHIHELQALLSVGLNLKQLKFGMVTLNPVKQRMLSKKMTSTLNTNYPFYKLVRVLVRMHWVECNLPFSYYRLAQLPLSILVPIFKSLAHSMGIKAKESEIQQAISAIFEEEKLPLFVNQFPEDKIGKPKRMMLETIQSQKGMKKYNHVILSNSKLLFGRITKKVGGSHIDLAQGSPVLASGEISFNNGKLVEVDNASWHYLPSGPESKETVVKALDKLGVYKAEKKYKEKQWIADDSDPSRGKWQVMKRK